MQPYKCGQPPEYGIVNETVVREGDVQQQAVNTCDKTKQSECQSSDEKKQGGSGRYERLARPTDL
jgi:hypothetical protein